MTEKQQTCARMEANQGSNYVMRGHLRRRHLNQFLKDGVKLVGKAKESVGWRMKRIFQEEEAAGASHRLESSWEAWALDSGWRSCFQEITEGLPCCDPLKGLKRRGITMLCCKNDYFRGPCGLPGRHSGSWKPVKKATVVVLVKDHEDWIKEGPRGLWRKEWIQKVIWRGKGYGRRVACMWKGGGKTKPSRFWRGDLCVNQG